MPWQIWRLWLNKTDSLHELSNLWSIDDITIANQLLDAQEDMQKEQEMRNKK